MPIEQSAGRRCLTFDRSTWSSGVRSPLGGACRGFLLRFRGEEVHMHLFASYPCCVSKPARAVVGAFLAVWFGRTRAAINAPHSRPNNGSN